MSVDVTEVARGDITASARAHDEQIGRSRCLGDCLTGTVQDDRSFGATFDIDGGQQLDDA